MDFTILGGLALIFSSIAGLLKAKDEDKKMREAVEEEVKRQLSSKEKDLD